MSKINMNDVVDRVRSSFKSDENIQKKIGTLSSLRPLEDKDFIKMPEWWSELSGTLGLPFGRVVVIAGGSDSGKTYTAFQALKSAVDQGCVCIYAETELKISTEDFRGLGFNEDDVLFIQSTVSEELFEYVFRAWDEIKTAAPDVPLLVIIDSLGNTVSMRDSDINLIEESSQPGGKGKINRLGLSKMVSKMHEDNVAILLISYTYDQMGSHGKVNAGGNALNFFSSLTFQTARKGWLEKTKDGKKVKIGAEAVWKLHKNHINRSAALNRETIIRLSNEGIEIVKGKKKEVTEENE